MNRQDIFSSLRTQSPEILIIGGGIVGAGVFRDLALQGVDVLLIERGDFGSGSSGAPSQIVSSGLSYLEHGQLRLMNEAVQERDRMIENAPHIIRPLPIVMPIFKLFSGLFKAPFKLLNLSDRPAERGALVTKIGLMFYDTFSKGQGTVPQHKFEGHAKSLGEYPKLHQGIKFTATYYGGQILSPGRFITELVLDGEAEGPHARALNYVSFEDVQNDQVMLKDELTGATFGVSPRCVVNAAGPWIDQVNSTLGISSHYVSSIKGSHLILNHPELREAIGKHGFSIEDKDGLPIFIIPFYDKVIIGPINIPGEEQYLIKLVSRIFPTIKVTSEHIIFSFSGVHPLETAEASCMEDRSGNIPVFSLVNGKWTGYRAFSERVADKSLSLLRKRRKADTRQLQIGGGKNYPVVGIAKIEFIKKIADETKLGNLQPKKLFERYGSRALEIAKYIKMGPDEPLKSNPDWTRREVEFLIEREKALHIDDILLRRSTLAWLGQVDRSLIEELAEIIGDSLGWMPDQKKAEVQRMLDLLRDLHEVNP